jgi:predicted outer membrane repeat protein
MSVRSPVIGVCILLAASTLLACGGGGDTAAAPALGPAPSTNASQCETPPLPELGQLATTLIGTGSAASCTEAALVAGLATGGLLEFNCGKAATTVTLGHTLVVKDKTHLKGGGLVTLDGAGAIQILRTQAHSTAVLEGLTFTRGASRNLGQPDADNGSGGAVYRGWNATLYVKGCTFTANEATGSEGFAGGAIGTASSGFMTIVGSTFEGNRSIYGGAVYSLLSDLVIVDSTFKNNVATDSDGGAIFTDGAYTPPSTEHGVHGGTISLCGSRFTRNEAKNSGGAGFLYAYGKDELVINRCEFSGNKVSGADPGLGGALRIDAIAYVRNSLFSLNDTAGQGGALWMGRGPAFFENVTFFANHAALWGGAISYAEQPIALNNCTLAANVADKGSDGLFGGVGKVTAHNSLFVGNGRAEGKNRHCRNPLLGDHNLVYPATPDDVCGPEPLHQDPLLATQLADNGGFTSTLLPASNSPALSAGQACTAADQRGTPRDVQRCDLGAVEVP